MVTISLKTDQETKQKAKATVKARAWSRCHQLEFWSLGMEPLRDSSVFLSLCETEGSSFNTCFSHTLQFTVHSSSFFQYSNVLFCLSGVRRSHTGRDIIKDGRRVLHLRIKALSVAAGGGRPPPPSWALRTSALPCSVELQQWGYIY